MQIEYTVKFVKDLKALKGVASFSKIKNIAFEIAPEIETIGQFPNCIKMEGYENYYRIRMGDFRIGLKMEGEKLVFMRVLHRKDIYRYFP
jgi:mRNA interferase RelE/StbE